MSKHKLSIAALTLVSGFSITAARAADDAAGYLTTPQGAPGNRLRRRMRTHRRVDAGHALCQLRAATR